MLEKLQSIITKYQELQNQMMDPSVANDPQKMMHVSKETSAMQEKYELAKQYVDAHNQLEEAKELLNTEDDAEMIEMAKQQRHDAETTIEELAEKIKIALLPTDPNDNKNIFLEIRPAAGGDEAGLFAAQLLRMYLMYAQKIGWQTEIVEEQLSDIGGIKFVMVRIAGDKVYSRMKFESGVHRVQRIPETESQGRVHTSTVTVAIMPEVADVEVNIDPKDLTMDTFAASSAGGQNANKNQTGVRIHHNPTGLMVTIADSKSQLQNKEKAMQVLKAKLNQIEIDKQQQEQQDLRGNQIGSGDRSEKIRTYNFPQDRITDHRIKHSRSNIPDVLSGNLDEILNTMILENQAKLMEQTQKSE